MKKKEMQEFMLLGYYEDDGELSFIVFVDMLYIHEKEFYGVVIASNDSDSSNPRVGETDSWCYKDPHWKQIPNRSVNGL